MTTRSRRPLRFFVIMWVALKRAGVFFVLCAVNRGPAAVSAPQLLLQKSCILQVLHERLVAASDQCTELVDVHRREDR